MTEYDSSVIVAFADALYAQADAIVAMYTAVGALVGAALGAAVGAQFHQIWLVAICASILVGAIAFKIGRQRAFSLRLQAQVALCQVQIEANTRQHLGHTAR